MFLLIMSVGHNEMCMERIVIQKTSSCYNIFMNRFVIMGLGNPGVEYEATRHNAGRIVLDALQKRGDFTAWSVDKMLRSRVSDGIIGGVPVILAEPETYMNDSGAAAAKLAPAPEGPARLIVIHDDLDLPIGGFKLSFDRGAASNNGVASIIAALKTKAFLRVRIGIAPVTFFGKTRIIRGEKRPAFVLSTFTPREHDKIIALAKDIEQALAIVLAEGRARAMEKYN